MRITLNKTARSDPRKEWRAWFAWYPVIIDLQEKEIVLWLERIQRKGGYVGGPRHWYWLWEYRLPDQIHSKPEKM